jgi:hypothetical protein
MEGRRGGSVCARAVAARRIAAMALVLCTVPLSACGSSSSPSKTTAARVRNLDVARVERSIERSILAQRHLRSTVVCPEEVPQRPGKFPCIATTFSAKHPHKRVKTPFVVTIVNSSGYVTYVGR